MPRFLVSLAVFGFFSVATPPGFAQDAFENLHVLPKDVTEDELSASMLENLRGLGLRRRQNEGCLHCHVGDMEQPADSWDWASDAKPAKAKARTMMAMVRDINAQHLEKLETRLEPPMRVTCYTCHAGRTDPRPLPDVLAAAYGEGGIESAIARYRELRERYFGGDAYDFRVGVLAGVAFGMAGRGALDDAVALAELNAEVHPTEPAARRILAAASSWTDPRRVRYRGSAQRVRSLGAWSRVRGYRPSASRRCRMGALSSRPSRRRARCVPA